MVWEGRGREASPYPDRLDPSPIPEGKANAISNRAHFSPDATVSISGHSLFIRSEAGIFGSLPQAL